MLDTLTLAVLNIIVLWAAIGAYTLVALALWDTITGGQ